MFDLIRNERRSYWDERIRGTLAHVEPHLNAEDSLTVAKVLRVIRSEGIF